MNDNYSKLYLEKIKENFSDIYEGFSENPCKGKYDWNSSGVWLPIYNQNSNSVGANFFWTSGHTTVCKNCDLNDCEKNRTFDKVITEHGDGACNANCEREETWLQHYEVKANPVNILQYAPGERDKVKKSFFKRHKFIPKGECSNRACDNPYAGKKFKEAKFDSAEGKVRKTKIHKCKEGEGSCPFKPVDCKYEYGKCKERNNDCSRELKITQNPNHGGEECPTDKFVKCNEGEDECPFKPIDCQEAYGECYLVKDNDAPSNIKGKCGKKNVIYKNPNHGGKSCVNNKYKSCNEGEGNCPKDCDGNWSNCNEDCESTFTKTIEEKNGGKCPPNSKPKPECKPGMGQCVADIDCEGQWSECSSYPNCEKVYNHTVKQSGKGNNCRYRDGFIQKCDNCIPDIDCKGEWSECSSYPDCEKVYNHNIKKSGKGINCRYRDGYTKKCDSCEAPAPPPKEPGVVEDIDSTPVDDLKPEPTPTPTPAPAPAPTPAPEPKPEATPEPEATPAPAPAQESNESNTMVIYAMGAIILLLFAYIMMSGTKSL